MVVVNGTSFPRSCLVAQRRTLHQSNLGLVEDFDAAAHDPPNGHSPDCQVVLPYLGAFHWTVASRTQLLDANRTLFVSAGEDFTEANVVPGVGHSSLIVTPAPQVFEALCGMSKPVRLPAFRDAARPTTARAHVLGQRLRGLEVCDVGDHLMADELTLGLLRECLLESPKPAIRPLPVRAVERAKQFMHSRSVDGVTLSMVAREVGVCATYLTQAFTESEGMPLYRYQTRLRLAQALVLLPCCDDITELALELGFCSHSHFSNTFKAVYGMAPSAFRRLAGNRGAVQPEQQEPSSRDCRSQTPHRETEADRGRRQLPVSSHQSKADS